MSTERKNITQPSDWWSAFQRQADAEGLNLSEWLGECGVAFLPDEVAAKLSERQVCGVKPKSKTKAERKSGRTPDASTAKK